MKPDPFVCIEDAINACQLILVFTKGKTVAEYKSDLKTKAAVEREL